MTIKQREFVKQYIHFGNATEAAISVYNTKKRNVAGQIGYENLKKPEIKQAVQRYIEHRSVGVSDIADAFSDVVRNGSTSEKLEVISMYFKMNGLI